MAQTQGLILTTRFVIISALVGHRTLSSMTSRAKTRITSDFEGYHGLDGECKSLSNQTVPTIKTQLEYGSAQDLTLHSRVCVMCSVVAALCVRKTSDAIVTLAS